MVSESQRLQYLEAMGLTAWTARYRLPNAAPTPQCEWPAQEEALPPPPQARLHALLDTGPSEPEHASPARPPSDDHIAAAETARRDAKLSPARSARALLEGGGASAQSPIADEPAASSRTEKKKTPQGALRAPAAASVALRFTLQVAALDSRWLLLLPQQTPPEENDLRLLNRLFEAADINPGVEPDFLSFKWPMLENMPVGDALEEARQGLRAFIEGRRSRGWRPERVLSFGRLDAELERVLDFSGEVQEKHSCLLDLPCWHGPALAELSGSAELKRALWPELAQWRHWWRDSPSGSGPQEDDS